MYQWNPKSRNISSISFGNDAANFIHQEFNQQGVSKTSRVWRSLWKFLNKQLQINAVCDYGQSIRGLTKYSKQFFGKFNLFVFAPACKLPDQRAAISSMIPGYGLPTRFLEFFVFLGNYIIPIILKKSPITSLTDQTRKAENIFVPALVNEAFHYGVKADSDCARTKHIQIFHPKLTFAHHSAILQSRSTARKIVCENTPKIPPR